MSAESSGGMVVDTEFPLSRVPEYIQYNYNEIMRHEPLLAEAAEAVHSAFQGLLTGQPITANESNLVTQILAWKSDEAWMEATVLAASGHSDLARADLRRAIEFCCNAAKVAGNEKRALDWLNFHEDDAARTR